MQFRYRGKEQEATNEYQDFRPVKARWSVLEVGVRETQEHPWMGVSIKNNYKSIG